MDKYFRTLGLLEVCKKNLKHIKKTDKETYNNLLAYSNGINDFVLNERKNVMPVEFLLLGVKWE